MLWKLAKCVYADGKQRGADHSRVSAQPQEAVIKALGKPRSRNRYQGFDERTLLIHADVQSRFVANNVLGSGLWEAFENGTRGFDSIGCEVATDAHG